MTSEIRKTLQTALSKGTLVQLGLPEGAHEGFVIAMGPDLVLLQGIYEWQDAGALVVPVEVIEAVEVSDHHDDQIRILDFNSVKPTKRYSWVRLGSWGELFKALKFKDKFAVVSFGDEAEVGLVETVEDDLVVMKAVDPGGNWIDDELECSFDGITLVQFDDSYSRVLQRYVEKNAVPTSH